MAPDLQFMTSHCTAVLVSSVMMHDLRGQCLFPAYLMCLKICITALHSFTSQTHLFVRRKIRIQNQVRHWLRSNQTPQIQWLDTRKEGYRDTQPKQPAVETDRKKDRAAKGRPSRQQPSVTLRIEATGSAHLDKRTIDWLNKFERFSEPGDSAD